MFAHLNKVSSSYFSCRRFMLVNTFTDTRKMVGIQVQLVEKSRAKVVGSGSFFLGRVGKQECNSIL